MFGSMFDCLCYDTISTFKKLCRQFLGSTGFMGKMEDRMYGIGASLDVAGSRFSVILVMIISILLKIAATDKKKCIGLYWVAFS